MPDTPEDFAEFFRREFGALVAFVRKLGFELEDARDAAAEAMKDAYRSWERIDRPLAWIRVAAQRIALKQARRQRQGARHALQVWAGSRGLAADQLEEIDGQLRLLTLLSSLPAQQREVVAWYLDGFGTDEIARNLGISEATVRSTKRHARNLLGKRLDDLRRGLGQEGDDYAS